MNEIFIYPAIIKKLAANDYNVRFVDFDHIVTYGEDMNKAYIMAEDALALELFDLYEDKEAFPKATDISNITIASDETLILVKADMKEILKKYDNKAVRKNLTIPSWLEKKATEAKINYSQVLQEALEAKLSEQ